MRVACLRRKPEASALAAVECRGRCSRLCEPARYRIVWQEGGVLLAFADGRGGCPPTPAQVPARSLDSFASQAPNGLTATLPVSRRAALALRSVASSPPRLRCLAAGARDGGCIALTAWLMLLEKEVRR